MTSVILTTALFITVVPTVVPVVTHKRIWDTVAIRALKLVDGTVVRCCKYIKIKINYC